MLLNLFCFLFSSFFIMQCYCYVFPGGFECAWRECGHDTFPGFPEVMRHINFHAFHVKIKSQGMILILKNNLRGCMLDSASRNMIPELPDRLVCGWVHCQVSHTTTYTTTTVSTHSTLTLTFWKCGLMFQYLHMFLIKYPQLDLGYEMKVVMCWA